MADKLTLDKSAMKDRSTAHLRIFVGGITEKSSLDGLYEHFQEYGQINGIVINKGFGFIQFENESSVQMAINRANGSQFEGKPLTVRPAVRNPEKRREVEVVDVTPEIPYAVAVHNNMVEQDMSRGGGEEEEYENYGEEEEGYGHGRSRVRSRGVRRRRGGGEGGYRERSPMMPPDRYPPPPGPAFNRQLPIIEKNDCEIIVVSRTLTEYAEYIESRLKHLGIVVDLLYPMEDVPLGKVLGNIASRGCLYAILVMPINMQKRSLTLSILHGMPQEHRNIPVDDAMSLLMRNFEEVKRGGGGAAAAKEAVFALLGQLADGRTLAAAQYERVIEYLQVRLEKQKKLEEGVLTAAPVAATKVEDALEQRILNILNEKNIKPTDIAPAPAKAPPPPAPKPNNALLSDPTVRKALDSIMQKFV